MGIQGLSSSSPMPENSGFHSNSAEYNNESNNISIFAEFNDSDGKVDVKDVTYKKNAKEDSGILKFLFSHSGEKWTDSLLQKINSYIEQFNTKMSKKSDSPKSAREEFDAFTKDAFSEYDAADARNKAEAVAFKQSAEGKVLEFENNNKNLTKEFKIKSMTSILNDLEKGYSGAIIIDNGNFAISYDNENKTFVLESKGKKQALDKEQLPDVLSIFAEKATSIAGRSKIVISK